MPDKKIKIKKDKLAEEQAAARKILGDTLKGGSGVPSTIEKKEDIIPEAKDYSKDEDAVAAIVKKDNIKMPSAKVEIDIPELSLEGFEVPVEDSGEVILDETTGSLKFGILGGGQAGGRIAKAFFDIGYKKCLVTNTGEHDLEKLALPDNRKIVLDIGASGAGKNMDKGKEAAVRFKQDIFEKMRNIYGNDIDYILCCFGGGGGSGGGSSEVLIDIAKQYMGFIGSDAPHQSVGCIMSLPTRGEGNSPKVAGNAAETLQNMGRLASGNQMTPLIIIDNSKIERQYTGLTVKQFWPTINGTIAGLFDIFNRLSNLPSSYTSFDPTDYRTVLQAGGLSVMGVTTVTDFASDTSISKAVRQNIEKTLLCDVDLSTATMGASIAVGGEELMENTPGLMDNLNYGFDTLASLCPKATIHRGVYEDNKDALRIYTIIGGLDIPYNRLRTLRVAAGEEVYP